MQKTKPGFFRGEKILVTRCGRAAGVSDYCYFGWRDSNAFAFGLLSSMLGFDLLFTSHLRLDIRALIGW